MNGHLGNAIWELLIKVNFFLARTFPLDNYCLFAHVETKKKKDEVHLNGK